MLSSHRLWAPHVTGKKAPFPPYVGDDFVTSIFNLLASSLCSPIHLNPFPPGDLVTDNIALPSCRFQTVTQMVRVWRNECLRVFHDRLINEVDKQLVSMRNALVYGNPT